MGPGVVCLVFSPTDLPLSTLVKSIKVRGNLIILNDRWGPALIHFKSDLSQLCLVGEITLGNTGHSLADFKFFPPIGHSPLKDWRRFPQ